jgi:hypothetical protein
MDEPDSVRHAGRVGTGRLRLVVGAALAHGTAALALLAACAAPAVEPPAPPVASTVFSFAEGRLGYGGRFIDFPAELADIESLLGPASRAVTRSDTTHVWDDLGVRGRCTPKGEGRVTELSVLFRVRTGADSHPTRACAAVIAVPGGLLRATSTEAELSALGFRDQTGIGLWGRELGRYVLIVQTDSGVTAASFSWRGPDPQHVAGPPLGPSEMFRADSRDYEFPFDEIFQEVERRGNVSVLHHTIHGKGGVAGRSLFACGVLGELARRRGWTYCVRLGDGPPEVLESSDESRVIRCVVGFTNLEEPDFVREFPHDAEAGGDYTPMRHDFVLDLFGDWPDGGRPWKTAKDRNP